MRLLVDECTGPAVAGHLIGAGHEVLSVYEQARGIPDGEVLRKAQAEGWILVTNDKGFGERIFLRGERHHGVVLLRLADERAANKIAVLDRLLSGYAAEIPNAFAVASETAVRIVKQR
ncbi:MAG: DUF5615 family PIN-like protein [Armatimonadetes bacterium]|nr:DUF5615 family PIN-like protein [Armatimonadota bacterium]